VSKTSGVGPSVGTKPEDRLIEEEAISPPGEPKAAPEPRHVQLASSEEALASARRIMEKYDAVLVELAK
jgi:hypothetical protein